MLKKISANIGALFSVAGVASFAVRSRCPGCGATFRHRPECEFKVLSIEEAATLDIEAARKIAAERQKE